MSEQAQPKATILVVDDDPAIRSGLRWTFNECYRVLEASTRAEAVEQLQRERVDVVLSDLRLPPAVNDITEGLAVIEAARAMRLPVPVIVVTASEAKKAALEAVRRGAYGFFEKPFNPEEVRHIVHQAAHSHELEREIMRLRSELMGSRGFGHLIGASPALDATLKQARAVAKTSATVLLPGEHGTGKDVLARAIHEESARVRPLRRRLLRGAARDADRVGTLRPREGLLHRRARAARGALQAGRRWNLVPRRDQRGAHVDAGQNPTFLAGAPVRARGRQ